MGRSKSPKEMIAFAVAAHVEVRPARQCPTCRRKWPFDWDYCPECAVWIRGAEAAERLTRLVPVADAGAIGRVPDGGSPDLAAMRDSLVLACEVRCGLEQPSAGEIRRGAELLRAAAVAIAAHGGTAHPVPEAGVMGCWASGAEAADAVSRAAAAILQGPASSANGPRRDLGVSLGIGIVAAAEPGGSPGDPVRLAFRLASLAHPNTALVSRTVYDRTVERFDYRGVGPVVPKSDPLPEPVFQLLRLKPERSGTHHVGPERAPLIGRGQLLSALDECHRCAAAGQGIVAHLIGEPGAGKSKLLREWLAAAERRGDLAGWIRMQAHGVPYGGYPYRGWGLLLPPLNLPEVENASACRWRFPGRRKSFRACGAGNTQL